MEEKCRTCDWYDGSDSTCHWTAPPAIWMLADMATSEPAAHIDHKSALKKQIKVAEDDWCSCWKPQELD